jgi:TM2 domain-containing membrane protein YozV
MKNKMVAALFALFLGHFGFHRFYLGHKGSGLARVLISLTIYGLLITTPWAFIDMLILLMMDDGEFDERYNNRPKVAPAPEKSFWGGGYQTAIDTLPQTSPSRVSPSPERWPSPPR